mmetsp:Transcript_39535/g.99009  ORF Transcript_39535/g.99009 Transcript_39535/m.99009 type:complete len:375 (-) Transcript_39535:82-1206(-)
MARIEGSLGADGVTVKFGQPSAAMAFRSSFSGMSGDARAKLTFAMGTLEEQSSNEIRVYEVPLPAPSGRPVRTLHRDPPAAVASQPDPVTRIVWQPDFARSSERLIASGEALRLYEYSDGGDGASLRPIRVFRPPQLHTANTEASSEDSLLTSCDWSWGESWKAAACAEEGNVTLFDLNRGEAVSTFIAHPTGMDDVRFGSSSLLTAGRDGQLRHFDLRTKPTAFCCLYSNTGPDAAPNCREGPILRIETNPLDENFVALIEREDMRVTIVDLRKVNKPFCARSTSFPTGIAWHPANSKRLLSTYERGQLIMWSIESTKDAEQHRTKSVGGLGLREEAFGVQWSRVHTDWKALQHIDSVVLTNALADTDRDMVN